LRAVRSNSADRSSKNDSSDAHAVHLQQLLESFGYVQHVTGPTHSAGHTLDLVIARRDTEISDLYVGGMISVTKAPDWAVSMTAGINSNVEVCEKAKHHTELFW